MRIARVGSGVLLLPALVACSGTRNDAGGGSSDASVTDAPALDAAADQASHDASLQPPTVLAYDVAQVLGITSDGYVIYDTTDVGKGVHSTNAVSLDGGPISVIVPPAPFVLQGGVAGRAYAFVDYYTGLNVWTHANGTKTPAYPGPVTNWFGVGSDDGARVAFYDGSRLSVVDTDGLNSKILVTGVAPCDPYVRFLPNGDLFAEYCLDGAAPQPYTASVFASPDFTKRDLATQLQPLPASRAELVDPTRTWFWAAGANGPMNGSLVNIASGASTLVDSNVGEGFFDASGQTLFYASSGALKRAAVTNPTASTTLVASGYGALWAASPDGQHILYSPPSRSDLYLASASVQAAPVPVYTSGDARFYLPLDNFTADSKFIVYATNDPAANQGRWILRTAPVTGTPSTTLGTNLDTSCSTHGSTILYGDGQAHALMTVDVAAGGPPRAFATTGGAESMGAGFQLTSDRARVVYVNAADHTLHVAGVP